MERLTYRLNDQCDNPTDSIILKPYLRYEDPETRKKILNRLAAYEETGMEPEEINDMALEVATLKTIESMYDGFGKPDHIRDLLQAEQDGRLVVLPCKVGDRVFHVRRVTQAEAKRMGAPTRHRGIVYYEDRPFAIKEKLCTKSDYVQIGKTVFLTREEAEAAMAQKGGEG